jgi:hypothetical protein
MAYDREEFAAVVTLFYHSLEILNMKDHNKIQIMSQ